MDKERLADLKEQSEYILDQLRKGQPVISSIDPNDFKWLIKQAERVKVLDEENQQLYKKMHELRKDAKEWYKQANSINEENNELREENHKLRLQIGRETD